MDNVRIIINLLLGLSFIALVLVLIGAVGVAVVRELDATYEHICVNEQVVESVDYVFDYGTMTTLENGDRHVFGKYSSAKPGDTVCLSGYREKHYADENQEKE